MAEKIDRSPIAGIDQPLQPGPILHREE
jgi:hypothetical protein